MAMASEAIDKRKEADADKPMDARESRLKKEAEKYGERSSDLKRKSYASSEKSVPKIRDSSCKKERLENFVPVPDPLPQKARLEQERVTTLDHPKSRAAGGSKTPVMDFTAVGKAAVNLQGYSTDLNITKGSLSNPKQPAKLRLEEVAKEIQAARQTIQKLREESRSPFPMRCNFELLKNAAAVIDSGAKSILNSMRLRLQAVEGEKAIERTPAMESVWETIMELGGVDDARFLLYKGVKYFPLDVDLWLALAILETHDKARNVLNKARQKLPKESVFWITDAKLEEANGNTNAAILGRTIERGMRALQTEGLAIDREAWIKEAEAAEKAGFLATCKAIIQNAICVGVAGEDGKRTWVADAEECKKRGSIETARAIYAHALKVFPTEKIFCSEAAQLEKSHGTWKSLDALLSKALIHRPLDEVLSLMNEEHRWLYGDLYAARSVCLKSKLSISNHVEKWCAPLKPEIDPETRLLFAKVREKLCREQGRGWMKRAILAREGGNSEKERKLLEDGLKQFPSFFKMWLMLGQLEERFGELENAKKVYESGLKHCPDCVPLWLSLANLEEKMKGIATARAVLAQARKKNPQQPELWLAAVRAELRHGYKKEADIWMAKALQECPNSGVLWAAAIEMASQPQRESIILDACKNCERDGHVVATKAKLFWQDGNVDEARSWFYRAVTVAPDIGDNWALYYKFELEHGSEKNQKDVVQRCVAAKPKHGEKWQAISKAVRNFTLPTEAILKKVVVAL